MKHVLFLILSIPFIASADAGLDQKLAEFEGHYRSYACSEYKNGALVKIRRANVITRYDHHKVPGLIIESQFMPFEDWAGNTLSFKRTYSIAAINRTKGWWKTHFSVNDKSLSYAIHDHSMHRFQRVAQSSNLKWVDPNKTSLVFGSTYAGDSETIAAIIRTLGACLLTRIPEAEYNAQMAAKISPYLPSGGDRQ